MSRRALLSIFILLPILVFVGCGDDTVTDPGNDPEPTGSVFRGDMGGGSDFEFTAASAGDPSRPIDGPFAIRGRNLHYDDTIGALVVDLTVINLGRTSHPEPVSLIFLDLIPDNVTVLNSDNGEAGPGAEVVFEFENDDAQWTQREQSLPRTVHFGVDAGVSIGFVARLEVGTTPEGGAIGGLVWNDENENGEQDSNEGGIAGAVISLFAGANIDPNSDDFHWVTRTSEDGTYRFDNLRAGVYTVAKRTRDNLMATTPTMIQVLLTAASGEVSDFLDADFGCIEKDQPNDELIQVGDFVWVKGKFALEGNTLGEGIVIADEIEVARCEGPLTPPVRPCLEPNSWLSGTVTDINLDDHAVEIMGTWVIFPTAEPDSMPDDSTGTHLGGLNLEDVEVGDRVTATIANLSPASNRLFGRELIEYDGEEDRVNGFVMRVEHGEAREIVALRVLNTTIAVTENTEIFVRENGLNP